MLYAFVLGIGLLVGLAFLIPWLTEADPRRLLGALKWVVPGLVALLGLTLLATGRLGWALAALAAAAPWLLRLVVLGRAAHRTFGNPFRGAGGGTSKVTSRFLRMRLDLGSGVMEGTVIAGAWAGRRLSSLSVADALELRAEVAADADSRRLLDAWLDRTHPGWRDRRDAGAGAEAGAGAGTAGGAGAGDHMDRAEALRVLGLEEGASAEAVVAAYRRLMAQAHPDHGGSAWIAAKLNQARDILLGGVD
jgi:hypothetical protein